MLSVIIPITGENRKKHVETCITFLRKQSWKDFEIVLIEQIDAMLGGSRTGGPLYENVPGIDKYLKIRDPGENHFNQPWMANVGARISDGDKFLFYDIDIVCTDNYLQSVYNFDAPYFIAWNNMYCLTPENSDKVHTNKDIENEYISNAEVYCSGTLDYAGFAVCITKNFFYNKLGEYNENYLGWGGNDNDIAWRALKILGREFKFKHNLYHMWHPKGYSKYMLWERRDVWLTTYKNPMKVNNRLLAIKKGNPNKQTYIDIRDIRVDSKKEHIKKRTNK